MLNIYLIKLTTRKYQVFGNDDNEKRKATFKCILDHRHRTIADKKKRQERRKDKNKIQLSVFWSSINPSLLLFLSCFAVLSEMCFKIVTFFLFKSDFKKNIQKLPHWRNSFGLKITRNVLRIDNPKYLTRTLVQWCRQSFLWIQC